MVLFCCCFDAGILYKYDHCWIVLFCYDQYSSFVFEVIVIALFEDIAHLIDIVIAVDVAISTQFYSLINHEIQRLLHLNSL